MLDAPLAIDSGSTVRLPTAPDEFAVTPGAKLRRPLASHCAHGQHVAICLTGSFFGVCKTLAKPSCLRRPCVRGVAGPGCFVQSWGVFPKTKTTHTYTHAQYIYIYIRFFLRTAFDPLSFHQFAPPMPLQDCQEGHGWGKMQEQRLNQGKATCRVDRQTDRCSCRFRLTGMHRVVWLCNVRHTSRNSASAIVNREIGKDPSAHHLLRDTHEFAADPGQGGLHLAYTLAVIQQVPSDSPVFRNTVLSAEANILFSACGRKPGTCRSFLPAPCLTHMLSMMPAAGM